MPWLRLWVDILDDPELDTLPEATCWAWAKLLAVAKRHDKDGELPDRKRLLVWMRRPPKVVDRWIADLKAAGLIDEANGIMTMHGWNRWQEPKDKTNAQRQARFKAAKKSPPLDSPEEEEKTQRESRAEGTVTQTPLPQDGNGPVTALPPRITPSFTPSRSLDELTTGRKGDEHKIFCEVVDELRAYKPTEMLAGQLVMAADSPGIRSLPSWRLWVAARRVQSPNKGKSWSLFETIAHTCTEDEYHKLKAVPTGMVNQPAIAKEADLARIKAELDKLPRVSPAEYAKRRHNAAI